MNGRPPQLSPHRLLAALVLPLLTYEIVHAVVGSATTALVIMAGVQALWLGAVAIVTRRIDPIALVVLVTSVFALAAFALTGGDALALELRRGAVTGPLGIAALASIALRRPLLLLVAESVAKVNPDRRDEIERRLSDPRRRRALTILTAIVGAFLTLDGVTQIALALLVPTGSFVADSTAVRIVVIGTGLVCTATYFRHQQHDLKGTAPQR